MNRETLAGSGADNDLDLLLMRVREVAGVEGGLNPAAGPGGEQVTAQPVDVGAVLAAQAAWNERTTKALAVIVECLQNLHDATRHSQTHTRTTSTLTRPTVGNGRFSVVRAQRIRSRSKSKNNKTGRRP
jgi:hypothetical protein